MEADMQTDVYVDILFLINFSMDYLCLYVTARVLHQRMLLPRMLLACALGGAYSVVSLLLPLNAPLELAADGFMCIVICLAAFYSRGTRLGSALATVFLYVGISMMTGGCMTAIFNLLNKLSLPLYLVGEDGVSTYIFAFLAAIAGIISLKSGQIISKKGSVRECKVCLKFCGTDFEFSGFADSGNLVKDPISGRPIIFLDRSELEKKCSLDFLDDFAKGILPNSTLAMGLRIVNLHTASGSSAAVAARPESLTIEYCDSRGVRHTLFPDALIAATDVGRSANGYNAIVPSEIIH